MSEQMDIDAGKNRLIDILKDEGKYEQFMHLTRSGKIKKAQAMVEEILSRRRGEFDKVMGGK